MVLKEFVSIKTTETLIKSVELNPSKLILISGLFS